MDIKSRISEQLIESFKPRSLAGACVLCGRSGNPMTLHLLEATFRESLKLPRSFTPLSRSRGVIRGGFGICTDCAPLCSKCELPIPSKKFRNALKKFEETAWEGVGIYAGNGYCEHIHPWVTFFSKGLKKNFTTPFENQAVETVRGVETVKTDDDEEDGMSTGTARLMQARKHRIKEGGSET